MSSEPDSSLVPTVIFDVCLAVKKAVEMQVFMETFTQLIEEVTKKLSQIYNLCFST